MLVQGIGEDISSSLDQRSEELRSLSVHSWAPPPRIVGSKLFSPDHRSDSPSEPTRAIDGTQRCLERLEVLHDHAVVHQVLVAYERLQDMASGIAA